MSGNQTLAPLAGIGGNQPQLAALLSPYTVTASDGTGVQLINCKLNGDNYLTWSRLMRISLRAKNKIGFIDGTLPEPAEGEPNRALLVIANSTVVAWIANTLEKDLQPSIACIENVKILWDDLKQRFSQGNETRIYQLKCEIYQLKQEGRPVSEYYSLLKGLWDELDQLLEETGCTCACICGIGATRTAQREKEKAHQFLMGLNPNFNTVRSNILNLEIFPSLSRVFQMVIHDERQRMVIRAQEIGPEAAAYMARGGKEI
ncbi:hypothetical protein CRG98_015891 [Punica granatum]|uniref:Retrotransposon Copia-like N-terminal domain-containing protein n=1 Tax=Punica granatum TaxID=22663 RepID=A0A2I0K579_PUNGR|nr:hypothetical protein CRG98_015891 [Punica granatum]